VSRPRLPEVFEVSRESAAGTQLETAIRLWFEEKDSTSIHTLAIAASGILHQVCKEKGIESSLVNDLIEKKPPAIRKGFRSAQNLFKHGRHEVSRWKKVTYLIPELTELVLIDCCLMYRRLIGTLSPLMLLYCFRYSLFEPNLFTMDVTIKGFEIEYLRRLTRRKFLEEVFPRFRRKIGTILA
jgi:hypothetical protein